MEIKEEMLNALKNRKEDEFNIGDIDYIYKGIDIGNIRKKLDIDQLIYLIILRRKRII